jgi:hypothetical protein
MPGSEDANSDLEPKMASALGYSGSDRDTIERQRLAERHTQVERERKYQNRLAGRQADLAAAEARATRIREDTKREAEDLELAQHGLKRSFWTGRVIPVNSSRRARAHQRRLSKGRYV